jgi:hypothetical protein
MTRAAQCWCVPAADRTGRGDHLPQRVGDRLGDTRVRVTRVRLTVAVDHLVPRTAGVERAQHVDDVGIVRGQASPDHTSVEERGTGGGAFPPVAEMARAPAAKLAIIWVRRPAASSLQLVSQATDGDQVARAARFVLDLRSQPPDVYLDQALVAVLVLPHPFQQMLTGERAPARRVRPTRR